MSLQEIGNSFLFGFLLVLARLVSALRADLHQSVRKHEKQQEQTKG